MQQNNSVAKDAEYVMYLTTIVNCSLLQNGGASYLVVEGIGNIIIVFVRISMEPPRSWTDGLDGCARTTGNLHKQEISRESGTHDATPLFVF